MDWLFKTKYRLSEILALGVCLFFALFLPGYLNLDKWPTFILIVGLIIIMRVIEIPIAKLLGKYDRKVKIKHYIFTFVLVPFLVIGMRMLGY
ncbi:hypothetical protein J2Z40_000244 [Cytobacillus eiseniae]|uniref:Uncharacterized protein n=1 Tax=Cytobacillus eiseniae TaxID=762947 RepID=A0ABS4R9Y0_9BACI|nr:hypothetical protein [Cytobacillus eiseniae]MBP2239691.1 hypothetical protein [Cytobacillus eiseniae]